MSWARRLSRSLGESASATGRLRPARRRPQIHAVSRWPCWAPQGSTTTAVSILPSQRRSDAGSARRFGRDPTLVRGSLVMFESLGRLIFRRRRWVLAAAGVLAVVAAVWGTGVFGSLAGAGFEDPHSDSA